MAPDYNAGRNRCFSNMNLKTEICIDNISKRGGLMKKKNVLSNSVPPLNKVC